MGKYLFFVSTQDACRAKRTVAKILLVVFGSVRTRGPYSPEHRGHYTLAGGLRQVTVPGSATPSRDGPTTEMVLPAETTCQTGHIMLVG